MREEIKNLIDESILLLYKREYALRFPINPIPIINGLYNCRSVTYEKLANISGKTILDVISACQSADGCTYYDKKRSRFLVAINTSGRNDQRIRWTSAHELGHIVSGHLIEVASNSSLLLSGDIEEEADYFAASFLAPFAAMRKIMVRDSEDISDCFGISKTASEIRWNEFCKTGSSPKEIELFFDNHSPQIPHKKYRFKTQHAIKVLPDADLSM